MGILDGKRILVAGVTIDTSIGFATAKVAQEQGATVLISNFGRALNITKRIAGRLPQEAPVLELDVTDDDHLAGLEAQVREHVDGLDGVVHAIAYGNPATILGDKFLTGPWEDVAQAVRVSAYSYQSLATACLPLMPDGGRHRRAARSTRRSPGRATTGWASPRVPSSRPTATWLATSDRRTSASTWSLPGRSRPWRPRRFRASSSSRSEWEKRAPIGWDQNDFDPTAPHDRGAAQRLHAEDDGRDRPRRRRLPRYGRVSSLIELRVLDGPNLYFPKAAVKLTVDLTVLLAADEDAALRFARRIGLSNARPGVADSGFRQRFAARAIARLVRQIAAEVGTHRLAVRVRPTADVHRVVVAYPWRHRGRATALGQAVAEVLDSLMSTDIDALVTKVAADVRAADRGDKPPTIKPHVPVIAVTGTNGKTTTSRMLGHIARCAGLHVGWSSTDGIYVDGELIEAGDYSGPSGAGRVLAYPQVQLAVTETARGGILLRGIGVRHNDVSVVTNVTADHLGLQGIDTLDQLAEVKSVVPRITKPTGWAVLNGDDPRVFAMRSVVVARPWVFTRDPDSPSIREVLNHGGRATTVIDGWVAVLEANRDPDPMIEVVDIPMTLSGLSHFNVENALAALSAALGAGLPRAAVLEGLRTFAPGPALNPGRMNIYSVQGVTVIVDLAHNEAGLEALVEVMRGLTGPGGRTLLALGTAGDRTDELLEALGEIAAHDSDVLVIVHKQRYLRGRDMAELDALYRAGAARVGVEEVPSYPSELEGLQALMERANPGDVIALMCHQDRDAVGEWLEERGATVDAPDTIRDKVLLGREPSDRGPA